MGPTLGSRSTARRSTATDISKRQASRSAIARRSWNKPVVGADPTAAQHDLHAMAVEQLDQNFGLLTEGRTFRELSHQAWFPPVDEYRGYSCLFHGVGQCDEYPFVPFPGSWESAGYDGVVEPDMCFTVESFIGARAGGEGVKLENQYVVTESGPELLSHFSLDLVPEIAGR